MMNNKNVDMSNENLVSRKVIIARLVLIICSIVVLLLLVMFIKYTKEMIKVENKYEIYVQSNNRQKMRDKISLVPNLDDYSSKREKKENVISKNIKSDDKLEELDIPKGIFKYIGIIKNKLNLTNNENNISINNILINDIDDLDDLDTNKIILNDEALRIQSLYDNNGYKKDSWVIFDEDLDGYGYNYYFDLNGKLLIDTITPDYKYVNIDGKEVDNELIPVIYEYRVINNDIVATYSHVVKNIVSSAVILSPGVKLGTSKVYDSTIKRDMLLYIDTSLRFKKRTNGTICDGIKWKSVSSFKDDGGYIIFINPSSNFNKVVGQVALQKPNTDNEKYIGNTLYVYDADTPYLDERDDVEPIYETLIESDIKNISFTFKRTVKRLKFVLMSDDTEYKPICYLKNFRYGFSNEAYKEELEEAATKDEYKRLMEELGIYISDEEDYSEYILNNIEDDYYEYEDWNDIDLYGSDYIENLSEEILLNKDREQMKVDRLTGPAFDDTLKNMEDRRFIGPGFVATFSSIGKDLHKLINNY